MNRRIFLKNTSSNLMGVGAGISVSSKAWGTEEKESSLTARSQPAAFGKPRDYRKESFKRLVIRGESTVEGGP